MENWGRQTLKAKPPQPVLAESEIQDRTQHLIDRLFLNRDSKETHIAYVMRMEKIEYGEAHAALRSLVKKNASPDEWNKLKDIADEPRDICTLIALEHKKIRERDAQPAR